MYFGKLTRWNDTKGFGFITPTNGGNDIFVHISAFSINELRPILNENISFEIEITADRKKKAVNVKRLLPVLPERKLVHARKSVYRKKKNNYSFLLIVLWIFIIVSVLGYGYRQYFHQPVKTVSIIDNSNFNANESNKPAIESPFKCDGRTHCSQMTSCDEATYFLKNCPGTQMDGNNDGIPCERQWCG